MFLFNSIPHARNAHIKHKDKLNIGKRIKKRAKNCFSRIKELFSPRILKTIMEITGKIIAVLPERGGTSKTGNEWKMQEYVLETHEQYPKKLCFNVFGADKIAQFNIQAGDELTVSFDINAREYNGRWYNDIRAWKVERGTAMPVDTPVVNAPKVEVPDFSKAANDPDDLPF